MDAYVAADTRYSRMPFPQTGRSGLRLPQISLGLWNNFGTDRSADLQRQIVLRAFDRGVTHFDLANNYGPPYGAAESRFGQILTTDLGAYRDEVVISTKAGYDMWPGPYGDGGSRKYLLASLDQSLRRLGVEQVDIFYSHRPDPATPIEETMGALASAVRQGKALYAGISNYGPEQTRAAHEALAVEGIPLLIHQPRYNMFDRTAESGLLQTIADLQIGSIVFSPLAGGLLTGRYLDGTVPSGSRAAEGRWLSEARLNPTYLHRARRLAQIAEARGQTLAQLALTWVLRQPSVTSALVGASSVRQLDESLDAVDAPDLTRDEIVAIDEFAVDGTDR